MAAKCKSLLIIEDEPDIRSVLQQTLEFEGYEAFTAANGQEGLELLAKIPRPCLILLDMMMPIMSGWEFLEKYSSDDVLATIPVVIVSAAGEKAKSSAAKDFIRKPVELDRLLQVVREYCTPAPKAAS